MSVSLIKDLTFTNNHTPGMGILKLASAVDLDRDHYVPGQGLLLLLDDECLEKMANWYGSGGRLWDTDHGFQYNMGGWGDTAGTMVGGAGGAIAGGTVGSVVPFAGTAAGTAIGGAAGSYAGKNIGRSALGRVGQGIDWLRGHKQTEMDREANRLSRWNPLSTENLLTTAGGAIIPGAGAAIGNMGRGAIVKSIMNAPGYNGRHTAQQLMNATPAHLRQVAERAGVTPSRLSWNMGGVGDLFGGMNRTGVHRANNLPWSQNVRNFGSNMRNKPWETTKNMTGQMWRHPSVAGKSPFLGTALLGTGLAIAGPNKFTDNQGNGQDQEQTWLGGGDQTGSHNGRLHRYLNSQFQQ